MLKNLIVSSLVIGAFAGHARAVTGPSPGAVSPQTVKLPAGPGSVRGLAENAAVSGYTGQVQYEIPIDLPHGAGGLTPQLALGYDGSLGNGPLGVGWQLAQASIRRTLRLGVPSYTSADELELVGVAGGGQLVQLPDGSYRAEGQGNSYRGVAVDGGFELTAPNGTVYRFGTTAAGRKASGTQVAVWYLEQVRDVAGQTISYGYHADQGELYLDAITWGPSIAGAPAFRAELIYETRNDAVISYRTGFRVATAQRLRRLRVWSFGAIQRVADLDYEQSFALSRLHRVAVTSADGSEALPAVILSYATAQPGAVVQVPDLNGWALNLSGTSLFDVDGDGAMDLLRMTATDHSYRRNIGGQFAAPVAVTGATGAALENLRFADLTGDSTPELVWQQGSQWSVFQLDGAHATWSAPVAWPGAQNVSLSSTALADLNGDYRMDVLSTSGSSIQVRMGGAAGLAAPVLMQAIDPARPFIAPGNSATSFPDLNGDGLADAVYLSSSSMFLYLGKGNGQFEKYVDLPYPWGGSLAISQIRIGDLNRDGLLDVAVVRAGDVAWYRGLANAALDPTPVVLTRPAGTDASVVVALADANGNGSEDIVWSSPTGMWILDFAGATSAGMLTAIDNGMGQTQAFHYQASTQLAFDAANRGAPWSTTMPVSIAVATSVVLTLASGDPDRASELSVRDAVYDRAERRFLGFLQSIQTFPGATAADTIRSITQYAQGLGADRVLRGQALSVRTEDGAGQVFRTIDNQISALAIDGMPPDPRLARAVNTQTRTSYSEAGESPATVQTRFVFDGEGRPIEEHRDGVVSVVGDETVVIRTYTASDPATGVRDLVCDESTLDGNLDLVSRTQRRFGDDTSVAAACQPGNGWVREELGWLVEDSRWVSLKRTSYDPVGNPLEVFTDGVTRVLGYDSYRLHPTSESVSPATGQTLAWTAQWDNVMGTMIRAGAPSGTTSQLGYDGVGRLISIGANDAPAHVYYRYRWATPRPVTETFLFDGDATAIPALPATWTPTSGWRHQLTASTSAGEQLLTATQLDTEQWNVAELRQRDHRGRVITLANPFGFIGSDPSQATLPSGAATQSLSYDALDRVIDQALSTGTHKRVTYHPRGATIVTDGLAPVENRVDGQDRPIHSTQIVNSVVETIDATYDAAGRVLQFSVQGGQIHHDFVYDSLGRLTYATDPDAGPRTMQYDDGGRLTHSTNGANETVAYRYDGAGRLVSVDGAGVATRYHYDVARLPGFDHAGGQLAWVEDTAGTLDLGYDVFGHETDRQRVLVDGTTVVSNRESIALSPSGLTRQLDLGDGVSLAVRYDAAGRVTQVGDLWSVTEYNAANLPMREQFGNGVTESYERDVLNRTSRIVVGAQTGALYDVAATYHPSGALATLIDNDHVGLDHTAQFDFDDGGRLTSAIIGTAPDAYQFHYAYDALQNMTQRLATGPSQLDALLGNYQYKLGSPRQLDRIVAIDGSVLASYDYDGAGRQIRHGALQLGYDALSHLIQIDGIGGAATVKHRYGHDGARVMTRAATGAASYLLSPDVIEHGGLRDHYVRIADRLLAKVTTPTVATVAPSVAPSAGGIMLVVLLAAALITAVSALRRMRWRPLAVQLALAALAGSCSTPVATYSSALTGADVSYFHQSYAAGPDVTTNSAGQLDRERRTEPFGQPLAELSGGVVHGFDYQANPVNALGKLSDPDTGWSDHGARWLMPDIAQWSSPDPAGLAPDLAFMARPGTLHPYQFVLQNPIAYWDPDGKNPAFSDLKNLTIQHGNPITNFANSTGQRWRDATPIATQSAPYIIGVAVVYSCIQDPVGCGISVAGELLGGHSNSGDLPILPSVKGALPVDEGQAARIAVEGVIENAAAGAQAEVRRLLPGLKLATQQFGKKAAQHLPDYGLSAASKADRSWLETHIRRIVGDYQSVRQGPWSGGARDNLFFRLQEDVVVTKADGTFVTVLKGGETNSWYKAARPLIE